MKITSNFALLDVTVGHEELNKHFEQRPLIGPCPEDLRIPVTLTGYLDNAWGDFDGTSQQFTVIVQSAEVTS